MFLTFISFGYRELYPLFHKLQGFTVLIIIGVVYEYINLLGRIFTTQNPNLGCDSNTTLILLLGWITLWCVILRELGKIKTRQDVVSM